MKAHEIIETVIINVCSIHGVKWQDVFNSKRKSDLMDIKHVITHILSCYIDFETVAEVTGFSKYHIYYCNNKYMAIRDNYHEIERYISKTIKEAA